MAGMSADPHARPLGRIERFYWLMDQQSCTNFVLTAELGPELALDALTEALARSWARHPRLRSRVVVDGAGSVRFETDAGGPPAIREHAGPWRSLADAQLLARFPAGSHPLIRVHWCAGERGANAVFTFAHGVLDGGAASAWLLELLADACGHPPTAPFPGEPCPSDERYPARLRGLRLLWSILALVLRDGLPRRLQGTPRALPGAAPWGTPRRPTTTHLDLDPQRSAALIQRCREAGCTVQGALMAAQLAALRAELPGDGAEPLAVAAALDLRPWLEPPLEPGTLGNHVSLLPVTVRMAPEAALAPVAAGISAQLRGMIARGFGHLFWRILPGPWFFPADARGLKRMASIGRAAPPSTVVTNLGRLPDPPPGLAQALHALRFTMAPQEGSPLCTGVATMNGALRMDLCFDAAHLDQERRKRIAERIASAIEGFQGPATRSTGARTSGRGSAGNWAP
jgi:hypothetical protein